MADDERGREKKHEEDDHDKDEPKVFEQVAGATRYSPVHFETDIQEAEENELVREAEEKLFLHNIEVADKFHQLSLDISIEDLFGLDPDEEEKEEKDEEA